ncbi:hydantoinase B/oxoprolinase family protein [Sphingomonas crocodyli]|uniref:Hydantoinase B/oxoprolinase family protein n=1 Tax=Sphingomonas crocodyli TaxID=1979270 RepID=A0A437M607_9SPHN|nr:hydantoinase B/oxoprolinase family protein [Sphingomonas crocodyli]RVT92934.1 hydantoinase B/oxoprolinase family protein [Sphingomonas crocodyli]
MNQAITRAFDAIAMEVFSNRMMSITEEMAITMVRSSFSAQIKERRDFSVGLFDDRGRLLAQGTHMPIHLGSLMGAMQAILKRYSADEISDGDAFICNDPYLAGGTHLPDISIVTPIYHDGRLLAFAANIGHHSDVGGSVPGSISAKARTIFEEGLRIPVIRIARNGVVDADLVNLIAANSRLSEQRGLDLRVQIATNDRGAEQLLELVRQMGEAEMRAAIEDTLTYTARRLRRRIADLPEGTHSFTTWLDDDGNGGDMVPIKVAVTVDGEQLLIDLDGTGAQARGALNVSESALRATIYYCVKSLLDPELLPNSGMFEAVKICAPLGTLANPRAPAANGARTIACQKIAGAVFGAFRNILPPERVVASAFDVLPTINLSGEITDGDSRRFYVFGESIGGGSGARHEHDGMDATHVHVTNSLNMPTEALENEYPLLVEEYGLVVDSGGAGRQRGGLGIARQIRALCDGTIVSARSDSHKRGAAGVDGGREGGRARLLRDADTPDEQVLESKIAGVILERGQTLRIETAGGGGFGPTQDRSIEAIAADLADGVISEAAALSDYGTDMVQRAQSWLLEH